MYHNPTLLSPDQLAIAPSNVILVAIYEYLVASMSFAFTILFLYWAFKFMLWFLPKWYQKGTQK